MRHFIWLGLIAGLLTGGAHAQAEDSCGPKSALCWPEVKRGASGPRVTALQYLLRNRGYKLAPDGKFAFATESAVRKFQAKNKLQVDGKIGWQSWEALTPNLKRGAKGDAVRALQTLLNFQKQKVARDGVFGSATETALEWCRAPYAPTGAPEKHLPASADDFDWCILTGGNYR